MKVLLLIAILSSAPLLLISLADSSPVDRIGSGITEQDIAARITLEGFKPFTLRGWRADFIEDGEVSGDCPWVAGYWGATATNGVETRHFKVAASNCDGYYISVRPVKSTDKEPAYRSDAPGVRRIEKPSFTAFEVFLNGCVIRPYRGMSWATLGAKGGVSSQGTFVELTLLNTRQPWGYSMEISGEKITLTPEKQREVFSLK